MAAPVKANVSQYDMSPSEYEQTVADIANGIIRGAPGLSDFELGFGSRNRLKGASGYKHQIDVSLVSPSEIFLIECKLWGRKVGVAEVLALYARALDIAGVDEHTEIHCILASNAGLTRGGKKLVTHFGIQVEMVKSASEFGFKIGKNIHVGLSESLALGSQVSIIHLRDGKEISD